MSKAEHSAETPCWMIHGNGVSPAAAAYWMLPSECRCNGNPWEIWVGKSKEDGVEDEGDHWTAIIGSLSIQSQKKAVYSNYTIYMQHHVTLAAEGKCIISVWRLRIRDFRLPQIEGLRPQSLLCSTFHHRMWDLGSEDASRSCLKYSNHEGFSGAT